MVNAVLDNILAGYGIEVPGELKHYGRKGMKWGVIRERGANGKVTNKIVSEDHSLALPLKTKKQSEMSNAELKRVNERLQLEKTNRELQSRGALQKIKAGTAIAGTILAVGTTITTAYNFANSPAAKAFRNAIAKNPTDPNWLF